MSEEPVIAWTDHAVLVRWKSQYGAAVWETWVYADAVQRISREQSD